MPKITHKDSDRLFGLQFQDELLEAFKEIIYEELSVYFEDFEVEVSGRGVNVTVPDTETAEEQAVAEDAVRRAIERASEAIDLAQYRTPGKEPIPIEKLPNLRRRYSGE